MLLAALIPLQGLMAQTRPVTGTVVSAENKQPLQGVTVTIKGSRTGTTTDANGNFRINAGENDVLVFSNVSFTTTEVTVGKNSNLSITLSSDAKAMDDVVVIGYQTVRRKDLLASVSSVGSKDLKDIPINSAAEALNGRLAGVTATTSEGSPDAEIRIRVRGGMSITGANSPLYIVDGVQVENGLSTISPQGI